MKRRDFVLRSTGAVLLGAEPFGVAAALRGPLLEDPVAWLGTKFRLPDGSRLELASVEPLVADRYSKQLRLQFRMLTGVAPHEGTHALDCGSSAEPLFLQVGRDGPVACINRLHRNI